MDMKFADIIGQTADSRVVSINDLDTEVIKLVTEI